jgi:methionyl-tRNA synthetase
VPFGQDGNYSHEAIVQRINADLANDLGNLAQRSLSMIAKNLDGRVPDAGTPTEADRQILARADALPETVRAAMNALQPHAALAEIWAVVAEANRYIANEAPWTLRKTDPARMAGVLYTTAEVLRAVGILVQPFVPAAAARLLDLLAAAPEARTVAAIGEGGRLPSGTALPPPQPIFPRYVEPDAA